MPATEGDEDAMTATQLGRRACAHHVASYTAVQLASTVAVTRSLGYRIPPAALLAGAAINAGTHYVIDRRAPLLRLADRAGKMGYVEHCSALRKKDDGSIVVEQSGPGTALFELDQAAHRVVGLAAAAVATWRATRHGRRRSRR